MCGMPKVASVCRASASTSARRLTSQVKADAAGPSDGDLEYARDSGRFCAVYTPVRPGVFDVDIYFGQNVRCDLGATGGPESSGSR